MEVPPPASRSISISYASPTETLLETVQIHLHHVTISPRTMVSSNPIQATPEKFDDRDTPIITGKNKPMGGIFSTPEEDAEFPKQGIFFDTEKMP